jgi:polysaccharide export outer membrane protein
MMMKKTKNIITFLIAFFVSSCSLSPGMHMGIDGSSNGKNFVYIESLERKIEIKNISNFARKTNLSFDPYRIGNGDQISITVWGLPDIFPISNINPDQNLRRVDSNGNIYFPYVGEIKANSKTQNELRDLLSNKLEKYFNSPQLDVSIARFNSQKVYLLGEVLRPSKINITDIPITLADAIGEVKGLNNNTSNGSEVFIIRQSLGGEPMILIADLSSPSGFLDAGRFYLEDNDIVYVNAKGTTRWNRVISQFFPFSSFLNSIDNLIQD